MKIQQIKYLLEQKKWVERNDDSNKRYNIRSQIKFKCTMIKSRLRVYSDVYVLVIRNVTGVGADAAVRRPDERDKQVIFKN